MATFLTKVKSALAALIFLFIPFAAGADVIEIPDCILFPDDPFCQGQCPFFPPSEKPPWCVQPLDPIVLIPGMLASQNKRVLYKDQSGGTWKFVFGGNVYKGLIQKLGEAGYIEGNNLFIAHYDWRKPVAETAVNYLKPMIDHAKQVTGKDKVDVIGHSMGGLLARAYIQDVEYENDVDQLITLGTPHKGASDAYVAWEGGKYPTNWDVFTRNKINDIENSLKKTRNLPTLQRPLTFRTFFPSLKDILPTSPFARRNNQEIPLGSLTQQNSFLAALNRAISQTISRVRFYTVAGKIEEKTLDKITLTNARSAEDIALRRWRDGAPLPDPPNPDSTEGDNRVLINSAHASTDPVTINDATHTGLPDKAQDKVIEILGLAPIVEQFNSGPQPTTLYGVTIMSPLEVKITGPDGKVLSLTQNDFGPDKAEYDDDPNDPDDPKVITLADLPPGTYTLTFTGTGAGPFTVIETYADGDETISNDFDGLAFPGRVFTQTINVTGTGAALTGPFNPYQLLNQLQAAAKTAQKNKLLTGYEWATFNRLAIHARDDLKIYEQRRKQKRFDAAQDRLVDYYANLDELERYANSLRSRPALAAFAQTIMNLVTQVKINSPDL